jgi:Zn finger protein HypA/HybF involved in hydrogenase expression
MILMAYLADGVLTCLDCGAKMGVYLKDCTKVCPYCRSNKLKTEAL